MKKSTRKRKQAASIFPQATGHDIFVDKVFQVISEGKKAFDSFAFEIGKMMAEAIMYMDREEVAGPDYNPNDSSIKKWASQPGSIFIGDQKVKVERPRLRGPEGEMALKSYEALKRRGQFSDELLAKMLRGLSGRQYEETLTDTV